MSPEDFIRIIATQVAKLVSDAPPKKFTVTRKNERGETREQANTSLPQLLAELNDNLLVSNRLMAEQIKLVRGQREQREKQ